jgi:hypothetical protein
MPWGKEEVMKRLIFYLILIMLVFVFFAQGSAVQLWGKDVKSRTFSESVKSAPGKTLVIDLRNADLTVTSSGSSKISVKAVVEVKSTKSDFPEKFLAATSLLLEPYRQGFRLKLKTPRDEKDFWRALKNRDIILSISNRVEVKVPSQQSLDIRNKYGDIFIEDISGKLLVNNSSGEVEINQCKGELDLTNRYAQVKIIDFEGPVEVKNHSGEVSIENISGDTVIDNSYKPVYFAKIGGDLIIKAQSGDVKGEDVKGDCNITRSQILKIIP